ncbi:protein kinase [Kitasatospora sp. NBC_01250]|uniref:serine/threonine-protein kinase n=1 Tax=Kitasatospora sp. NBC_01250 TaxID=2903571 RepID=UPI002E34FD5A|nr:protein kinase [Kitasatospora sp. NBC_01250]
MPQQTIAGRYEIVAPISTGGMGQVWRGYDTVLDREIAVKLIRPDVASGSSSLREEFIARFRREARVTAKIDHPGVPAVYDAAFDDQVDRLYLVMQLVDGVPLSQLIKERGRFSLSWSAAVAAQICSVLVHAHALPVVHRDLKPGNLMVARGGAVKVLDFGIAAVLRTDVTQITTAGQIIGTKAYMSPEQAECGAVSPRSDLYALGCILHELLTGVQVFDGPGDYTLMRQHVTEPPTPVRQLRGGLTADIEELILQLLAKRPEDRPADAHEVYERLAPHLPAPDDPSVREQADPIGALPDPTRPYRRPLAPRPRVSDPRLARPTPTVLDAAVPPLPPLTGVQPRVPEVSSEELDEAYNHAVSLVEDERFSQAAEVLAEVLAGAAARGEHDPRVLEIRRTRAAALFLGGDYRQALPEFDVLAEAYIALGGPDDVEALDCARQAAYCRAELGDSVEALVQCQSVLARVRARYGEHDEETFGLRRHVGLLLSAAQRRSEAIAELEGLMIDMTARYGAEDQETMEIRDLLTKIRFVGGAVD